MSYFLEGKSILVLLSRGSKCLGLTTPGSEIPGSRTVLGGSLRNSLEGDHRTTWPSSCSFNSTSDRAQKVSLGTLGRPCPSVLFCPLLFFISQDHKEAATGSHLAGRLDGDRVTTHGVS